MTVKSEFEAADAGRANLMERFRNCAALTETSVLPRASLTQGEAVKRAYQSIGSYGSENLVGRLLIALFPPGMPWYRFLPSIEFRVDPATTDEDVEDFSDYLYGRELMAQYKMDTTNYRMAQRAALEAIIVIGNSLSRLRDDYRMQVFRFDNWVQKRDGSGELLWTITKEKKDVSRLSDEILSLAGIRRQDYVNKSYNERCIDLFTDVKRQIDDSWVITQEINKKVISESEESVTPYFSCGYREYLGEDYSRGFIEARMGDLLSLNGLTHALIDTAAIIARSIIAVDTRKGYEPSDLLKDNGEVIVGFVNGNVPDGIGFIESNKQRDVGVTLSFVQHIEQRLGKAMLLESVAQPTGERVTATQIIRIAQELEGALGGVYAHIAEEIQRPYLNRFIWQMDRDNLLPPLDEGLKEDVTHEILTGIEALGRQLELERLLNGIQIVSQIPGAAERLNPQALADRIFRLQVIDDTGIVMTDEEVAARLQQASQNELQNEAAKQAISTVGKMVEQGSGKSEEAA